MLEERFWQEQAVGGRRRGQVEVKPKRSGVGGPIPAAWCMATPGLGEGCFRCGRKWKPGFGFWGWLGRLGPYCAPCRLEKEARGEVPATPPYEPR
jgi:hypothetical protein